MIEVTRLVPVDATDAMVAAALACNWEYEDEVGLVHNIWHAMCAAALASPAEVVEPVAWGAWSEFEQRVIAVTTDKLKADTYDGQGDINIIPVYTRPPQQEPARLREALIAIRNLSALDGHISDASAIIMARVSAIHQHADAALAEDGL